MYYFIFILKSALKDLFKNKMRTFLTSLGILIGVASVVLLLAFGMGLKSYIKGQFDSLGTNLIFVLPGKVFSQSGGFSNSGGFGGGIRFDEKDYVSLKRIREAEYVVPAFTKSVRVEANGKTEFSTFYATNDEIFQARNLTIKYGSVITKTEVEKRNKVVVLGPKISEKLFGSEENALNNSVRIENQAFKVIGVLEAKGGGGFGGPDFDSFVYAPYKSAYSINPNKIFSTMLLKAKSEEMIPMLKARTTEVMQKRYKEDDFQVAESTEFINTISSIFAVLNSFLVAIGAISLIVGGVGIMNIMYVSVTERIKEIGIRRALGATRKDILLQFLAESVLLSLIGGIAGLVIAIGLILLIRRFFPAAIDLTSMLVAIGTSSFIGIFFGVFPARKAANLSPMEAIRYE